ncbi:4Fe-4S single cluster domain-containing protein [Sphingomonas faeni]|uniref:4Fe-4S single cluster domain-containing protein n=1 Tax=Sphingomonas faeni TaxID=185950 RepID=UPI0033546CA9
MTVAVSRIHFPVTTLGPGRRLGVWLQGCSLRCSGCISVDTWDGGFGQVTLDSLLEAVAVHAPEADGLTVSGGEPFEQPDALAALLLGWRQASDRSVFVFTGREFTDIEPWLERNPGLIDALMTGPFRSDLPQTLALRGSDNQRLHVLTPLGAEMAVFERLSTPSDRRMDVMFDEDGDVWMAGIPARADVARLRRSLHAAGHRASTSADKGLFAE